MNYLAEEYPDDYYNLNLSNEDENNENDDDDDADEDQVYYSDEEDDLNRKTKARSNNLFENIYLLDEAKGAKKNNTSYAEDS